MHRSVVKLLTWGMAVAAAAQPPLQNSTTNHPFTVRDSIEMKVVSDPFSRTPGATAKAAPDGSGFVIVTTEGHLVSNKLESVLWYFSQAQLSAFLDGTATLPPSPRVLFRKIAVPEAFQPNSYGSLITDVAWLPDSRGLTFMVEGSHGTRHPFRLSLRDGIAQDMTATEKGDVTSFTSRSGTVAYVTSCPPEKPRQDSSLVSTVVTGRSIFNAIFSKEYPNPPGIEQAWKLRVRYRGKTLTIPSKNDTYFPYTASGLFTPAISPDGNSVVTVAPVQAIPGAWSAYRYANPAFRFIPSTASSDRTGRHISWPWQYALVNLTTGTIEPLLDAPTGYTTSWGGPFTASWSPSGASILLTKTYLPLLREKHYDANSISPCAIVEYTVKSRRYTCLTPNPSPEQDGTMISAEYDPSGAVVAQWLLHGRKVKRTLDRSTMTWASSDAQIPHSDSTTIYIHQDMDVAPTLWVKRGKENRQLWNLNPQLHATQLAKASVYRWTDSSGYTWRGGLVLPPGPPPKEGYPLVIQTHGFYNEHEFLADGAFTSGTAAQPLACAGIAVLQMEDRFGRHSRPPLQEADDAVGGIESAISHLADEHVIDRSRVGIQGFSRTSWYVEKALEKSPRFYKAAILVDGVDQSYVSEVLFSAGYPAKRADIEDSIGAPPFGAGLSKWMQNAAGFNLDKVEAAIRLEAHGPTFSVLGEWEMYSILQQQGKPVDLINILHGQHILQKPKERFDSQQGAVDWFRYWLQGYMRSDAESREQYKRWDALKRSRATSTD